MAQFGPLRSVVLKLDDKGRTVLEGFYENPDDDTDFGWIWCRLEGAAPLTCNLSDGLAVRRHSGWAISDETARLARLHVEACYWHGADEDTPPVEQDGRLCWASPSGDVTYSPTAPEGERWACWGAGSYPLWQA